MNDSQTVTSTMWLMILIQTVASVDMPGKGARKLPSPRAYVAIVVAWSFLELAANLGWAKLASRVSLVLVLAGTVLGPFGQILIGFMGSIVGPLAVAPPNPPTNQTGDNTP